MRNAKGSLVCFLLVLISSGFRLNAQTVALPTHVDELLTRATQFRRILGDGDRVKASEMVIASKRKDFLNNPPPSLQNIRPVGMDFIDKDHVYVRLSGESVSATVVTGQISQTSTSDLWVRDKGNWFFQPENGEFSLTNMFSHNAAADAAGQAEIRSVFKLLTDAVDVGELWQGDRKEVPIHFQYTGNLPIRIASKSDTPVTMIDVASNLSLTKDTNHFNLIVGSDDFDGPFDLPVTFTVYYQAIAALDQTVHLKGSIRPVCRYHQTPATVGPNDPEEFSIAITNNTAEPRHIKAIASDGKFFIAKYPADLAPGEEGIIIARREPHAVGPGKVMSVLLDNQSVGSRSCEIRVH